MRILTVTFIGLALLASACGSSENAHSGAGTTSTTSSGSTGVGGAAGVGGGGGSGGGGEGGGVPVDTTVRTYAADDVNIQYSGRIGLTDPKKPRFSSPGVNIQAKFRGNAVTVMLNDEHKWGKYFNYFDVVIDDTKVTKVKLLPDVTEYPIASDLPYGEHTVSVVKRTESSIGYSELLGFKFAGQILPPPAKPARRIEFIGDSITCGSGDEAANNSPQCSEDGWGQPYHNSRVAYGPDVARTLGAEYQLTSVSGIGLVRNYSSMYDARPMPAVYDLLYLEQQTSPAYDHSQYVPDAIVIALGTNDFSPGDSPRPKMDTTMYADAYVDFIHKLRGIYPQAHIFCISSPMLGDGWPQPTDTSATDLKTSLTLIESRMTMEGDTKVHKFFVDKVDGGGCGTHPTAAQQADMAAQLAPFIQSTMGW